MIMMNKLAKEPCRQCGLVFRFLFGHLLSSAIGWIIVCENV